MTVTIRRLSREDNTTDFEASPVFQRFLREYAWQNQERHHVGTTYVATTEARKVVGYATVALSSLELTSLPASSRKRLPKYPLPALRLAQLAVDGRQAGRGIGSALLAHVLRLAVELSGKAGCVGVVVDALPEKVEWYVKRSFLPMELRSGESGLKPATVPRFLPLATAIKAMGPREQEAS